MDFGHQESGHCTSDWCLQLKRGGLFDDVRSALVIHAYDKLAEVSPA
jgi:hypothetical protein